ncbi:hypothetical protein AXE65_01870 [Ventosimonas gracilis]|uniref:Uncharacterized protein n=1 Tax=Ventosimonas gracilis TaxID=1680762 RepID=A0A139SUS8_9GAMM|nr:hypothetical protein [Ventosimonas gracilis]KXU38337.1 hypothetical protein AXE65_01870 [Ventosimonas gracilis]
MNMPRVSRRISAAVVVQTLLFCWLLGLSVAMVLGYRAVNQLAEQVQTRVESQQVLALETRAAELAASIQVLEAKPEPAYAVLRTAASPLVHRTYKINLFPMLLPEVLVP